MRRIIQLDPRLRATPSSRSDLSGNCLAAQRVRQDPQGWLGGRNHPPAGARVFSQGRKAGGQGLRRVAGADLAVAGDLQIDADGQRGGQRAPQHLGERGDLLWAFPRWCREIHEDRRLIPLRGGYSVWRVRRLRRVQAAALRSSRWTLWQLLKFLLGLQR